MRYPLSYSAATAATDSEPVPLQVRDRSPADLRRRCRKRRELV